MLDLDTINSTIEELENGDTNFYNCEKLASLYTVKKFYEEKHQCSPQVEQELSDILPCYRKYCGVKRNYQMAEASKEHVLSSMQELCAEIVEFFHTLYSSTDMPEEREQLQELVKNLSFM